MLDDPLDQSVDEDDFVALREFFQRSIASRPVLPPRERFEVTTDVQMFDTREIKPFDDPIAAPSVQQQALKSGFPSSFDITGPATIHIGASTTFTINANAGDGLTHYNFNGNVTIPVDNSSYNSASFSGTLAGFIFFSGGTFTLVNGTGTFSVIISDPSSTDPTGSGSINFSVGDPSNPSYRAPKINFRTGNMTDFMQEPVAKP